MIKWNPVHFWIEHEELTSWLSTFVKFPGAKVLCLWHSLYMPDTIDPGFSRRAKQQKCWDRLQITSSYLEQCITGTRTWPATRYFFWYPTWPNSILKIIRYFWTPFENQYVRIKQWAKETLDWTHGFDKRESQHRSISPQGMYVVESSLVGFFVMLYRHMFLILIYYN